MSRRSPGLDSKAAPAPLAGERDPDEAFLAWLGERLRRVALGATAALLTARAYWPSEPDLRADAGGGMTWVLALLVAAGVGLAGAVAGGHQRFRWSWADAGVVVLAALVGLSAGHAVDRRLGINLAWEWAGFAVAFLLVRNLPKTRGESAALLGALAATAVALAVYGLYQVGVELPELQRKYMVNRGEALRLLQIVPGTSAEAQFENRLMHSNEPFSTFALANSLAGFLVGPLVVLLALCWDNLTRPDGKGSRAGALLLALPGVAAVLVCLTLTKSRSAYVGLAVGLLALAVRERTRVKPRTLALAALGSAAVVAALTAGGLATGRLDREVLTQSGKSFRYRREYWVGAWRAINATPRAYWRGYGPGNFASAYLKFKLPEASEEVSDPHDFVLEVWATAGVWAVVALGVAVVVGVGSPFLPPSAREEEIDGPHLVAASGSKKSQSDPASAPAGVGWLLACTGAGWVVAVLLGKLDLIGGGDFERWVILGGSWALAVGTGLALWRRRPVDPAVPAASALAVLVNLTAAGGIGVPTVALALWVTVAVALNLRDDRAPGRARGPLNRVAAFALAAVWVALLGTFVGAVAPYWKVEAALAQAEDAISARPPDFDRAAAAYERAKDADKFSARPWLALAQLEYQVWKERGFKAEDLRWRKIPITMLKAVSAPRSPESWSRHRERARMTNLLIKQLGDKLPPMEATRYRADVVQASRTASRLYPSNASLHAWLAEASADIGMYPDALDEAREALRLDALMPHADKKLEPGVRLWLGSKLKEWESSAEEIKKAQPPPVPKKG